MLWRLYLRRWILRWLILSVRYGANRKQQRQRRTCENSHATSAISMNRHESPPNNIAGNVAGGDPSLLAVVRTRQVALTSKENEMPRSILRTLPAQTTGKSRRNAEDRHRLQAQAAGGARERKATRSGVVMPRATLTECLMRSTPSGTGNCGGSDTNELETREIEAQIGQ